ncbi:hypothetical protein INT43_006536 [Umbelopsis isabellina]|uniref:C2H2-type domain-containing protein n=1 Tax=Mortierella isabellina TaxID=91625 RepID=A0A8H7UHR3_MORIS|nr:hypothetical protein INT43_006536 [Umbelopsis isabellina]
MSMVTSPVPAPLNNGGSEQSTLTCVWDDCSKTFLDHTTLAKHLSEGTASFTVVSSMGRAAFHYFPIEAHHVGWKKSDYVCLWKGCPRSNVKSNSRFALMMHLRTHTGEKPYTCTWPGCQQTFGRTDAMLKHRKTEHEKEEGQDETQKKEKSTKRKAMSSQANQERRPIDMSSASMVESNENFTQRYKVVKTKLSHILRENEMLNEEYLQATKKLKRLRTERRVLLDVLVAAEKGSQEKKHDQVDAPKPDAEAETDRKEDKAEEAAEEAAAEAAEEDEEEVDELMDEDDD